VRVCKALAAALIVGAFVFVGAGHASAESIGFHVASYRMRMDIQRDGSINVEETIDVDFADEPHHGIFEYRQVRYDWPKDSKYERVYKIGHVHTTATDISAHNAISDEQRFKLFKIGDPKRTATGRHTYVITYRLRGALNGFPDHDELYWDAIGNRWDVPIDHAEVVVSAPGGVQQVTCFAGPQGATTNCNASEVVSPTEADFAQEATLYPGTGLTIAVSMAKGNIAPKGVAPILDEKWAFQRAFAVTPTTVGASVFAFAVLGLAVLSKLWQTGRDRRRSAGADDERMPMFDRHGGPVQYRPPDDMRPAQVGVLIDETADPLDVTATIIDFGVRGYLTIEETEKAGLFHKADWRLTKTKEDDGSLLTYERRLFNALFDGRDQVSLSELKNKFAADLHHVQDSLYADAVERKWFAKRPDTVRNKYLALGVVATLAAIGVLVLLAIFTHAALIGVPLVIVGLIMLATHSMMPARTGAGSDALDRVMGFRTYMATAEADRMKFAEEEDIFAKYLPYAIVFHETGHWAKVFHDIYGDTPPPGMGWYSPYGSWNAFSFGGFASSMSNFAVQTSGTIVSTPSSSGSSGFGGGGFSGGGGGGGGGGGW
jgi:uncharacterized membrane protein YgcG